MNSVVAHFNTIIRYGINHGLRGREIRNVYNTIFHYCRLIDLFVKRRDEERVVQCSQYFCFYAKELIRLSLSEPLFVFLIEAFAEEVKNILMKLHDNQFPRDKQEAILNMFNELSSLEKGTPLSGSATVSAA